MEGDKKVFDEAYSLMWKSRMLGEQSVTLNVQERNSIMEALDHLSMLRYKLDHEISVMETRVGYYDRLIAASEKGSVAFDRRTNIRWSLNKELERLKEIRDYH